MLCISSRGIYFAGKVKDLQQLLAELDQQSNLSVVQLVKIRLH